MVKVRSLDDDGGPDFNVFKEMPRHVVRHTDAAVGCRIAWQVAGVHTDAAGDAHEVRHRRIVENLARRNLIHADVDVVVGGHTGGFIFKDPID